MGVESGIGLRATAKAGPQPGKRTWRSLAVAAMLAVLGGAIGVHDAMAERVIQIAQAKRAATITVYIGKSRMSAPKPALSS